MVCRTPDGIEDGKRSASLSVSCFLSYRGSYLGLALNKSFLLAKSSHFCFSKNISCLCYPHRNFAATGFFTATFGNTICLACKYLQTFTNFASVVPGFPKGLTIKEQKSATCTLTKSLKNKCWLNRACGCRIENRRNIFALDRCYAKSCRSVVELYRRCLSVRFRSFASRVCCVGE